MNKLLAAILLSLAFATPAMAQTTRPAPKSEAGSQSSNMGLPPDDNQDANNGTGTDGSIEHDHGKASSTVAGINGSTTGMGGNSSSKGADKPLEDQPSVGGGTQTGK